MTRLLLLPALFATLALPSAGLAIDRVIKTDGSETAGEVTEVDRDTVTVKSRTSGEQTVPTNEIDYIDFDAAPPSLGAGRAALQAGNIERAIEAFEKAKAESPDNRDIKGEIDYLQASTAIAQADGDEATLGAAIDQLQAFTDSATKHYRYYPALLELAAAKADAKRFTEAKLTFKNAATAPYADIKLAAEVGQGNAALADGKSGEASGLFDGVIAAGGGSPAEQSQVLAAKLGKAKVSIANQNYDEAIATLDDVIRETGIDDTRTQAEAYLRQGDAYAAKGNAAKNAILAYLHVDVVPALAREGKLHAEALYRLKELWPTVAKPTRAAESAARLQQLYPNSEWAGKL